MNPKIHNSHSVEMKALTRSKNKLAQLCQRFVLSMILSFVFILSTLQMSMAATLSGTVINSVATANYSVDGSQELTTASVLITTDTYTPSIISFHRLSDGGEDTTLSSSAYNSSENGGKLWNPIDVITRINGDKIIFPAPVKIIEANQFITNEPIIIRVQDFDQNLDPKIRETIFVTVTIPETNDKEVIQLKETSPSSGIFIGAVPTHSGETVNFDGRFNVKRGAKLTVSYHDQVDSTDISMTAAVIDPVGTLNLSKTADKKSASIGDVISYEITLRNSSIDKPLNDIKIQDTLPIGLRYQNGTALLNGAVLPESAIRIQGRSLTFTLGNMPSNVDSGWVLRYKTKIGINTAIADITNRAQAFSQNDTSNIAKARVRIEDVLMTNTIIITGRVYIGCEKAAPRKALANTRIYTESGRSVLSDKDGYWHMEGLSQQAHVMQLDIDSLPTGYRAIDCDHDNDRAGSKISKFVNSKTLWRADFYVAKNKLAIPLEKKSNKALKNSSNDPLKKYNKQFVNNANIGFEILWPPHNHVPAIASTKIAIKHPPKQKVKLYLNDKPISMLNYDGSTTNKAGTVTIRRWRGVDINIKQRDNILTAILLNKSGKEIARKTHTIHFSGTPSNIEYLEKESLLIADGKNSPIITLRIKDEDGFPMRANTHGYFSIKAGDYNIAQQSNTDTVDDESSTKGNYKYYIKEGGIAHIKLTPTTRSGQISIDFNLANKTQNINAWLKPKLRNWILVGIAEGTLAHKKLSGNLQTLIDKNQAENYKHGRLALFAKGRIKGDYLLTLAYDSAKQRHKNTENGAQLEGNIDPDTWYTVYADKSNSQYETSSSHKLYLKLEKNQFYALFGDYRTGLTVTELSRYERILDGLHSEYHGDKFSYNLFASYTEKRHQRDEIIGDGTSGLYHLSRPIVQNSEVIRLEARDQLNSGKIVSSQTMVRHKDYDIDYDSRTLFFKFPIAGRDKNLNTNIIVVDYESDDNNEKNLVAGGRVAAKFNDNKLETGLSIIQEGNSDDSTGRLVGLDLTYKPSKNTEIHAEVAQTQTTSDNKKSQGRAWLAEIKKSTEKTESTAYIRKQEANFGLGQQKTSEKGTQKLGLSSRYTINANTKIKGDISQQTNLQNDDITQRLSIEAEKQFENSNLSIGVRQSKNTTVSDSSGSTALLLGGSISTKDRKATLHGNIERQIAGRNHTSNDPDKAIVGLDVALSDRVNLFAEHEVSDDDDSITQSTRVGISSSLWQGAKLKTSLSRENKVDRSDTYALVGLSQHAKLSDHLLIDFSLDQATTIDSIIKQTTSADDALKEHGSNRDDYIATSLAYKWKNNSWSSSGRFEHRDGDLEDKINVQLELNHQIAEGKHLSAKIRSLRSSKHNNEQHQQSTISLGAAWQPFDASYSVLERLDYIDETDKNGSEHTQTRKLINNIHINKQINDDFEVGLHHGIQHIMSSNDAEQQEDSTVDVGLIEAKYKLSKMWAVGAHAGYSRDWENDNIEKVAGVSVSASPAKNTKISLGYNFEGFTDNEFDTSSYTAEGFFTQILYKFDQETLKLKTYDNDSTIKTEIMEDSKP